MSPAHLFIAALSTLLTVSSALAQMPAPAQQPTPNSKPYRLTRPELTELATQVCMARHSVSEDRISAWQELPQANPAMAKQGMGGPGMGGERVNNAPPRAGEPATPPPPDNNASNTPKLRALVDCNIHQELAKYSLSYSAQCERKDRWLCGPSDLTVRTTLQDRPLLIRTNGYKPELTQDLVQRLAVYRTAKGDPVLKPNTSQCSFAKGPEKDLLDVTCEGRVFRLSYWCPKSRCPRVFSIDGYFVPADVGGL